MHAFEVLRVVWRDALAYLHGTSIRARYARAHVAVAGGAVIKTQGRVVIAPGVSIEKDAKIVAGAPDGLIEIGPGTRINQRCFITAKRHIRIGADVLFANNVFVCDHLHAWEAREVPVMKQGATAPRPVEIGDGTWLGINVVVLPGVTIGKHCVIGANAVVTASVPDYSIAVGVPARVVQTLR